MEALCLGTGTSCGVPIIGCACKVCRSKDPRDRRRRTSLYVSFAGKGILVDTPPDFREQALAYQIPRVDAVFFTHAHADHIFGFDDIRRFNTIQGGVIPAYGDKSTLSDVRRAFHYISDRNTSDTYRPEIAFRDLDDPVRLEHFTVTPLRVEHGKQPTFGFLMEGGGKSLAYVPDCKVMPPETVSRIQGVDVIILDALRHRQHATHMTIDEALSCLARVQAKQSYLIHMCHEVGHAELEAGLPPGVGVAYDGLRISL